MKLAVFSMTLASLRVGGTTISGGTSNAGGGKYIASPSSPMIDLTGASGVDDFVTCMKGIKLKIVDA